MCSWLFAIVQYTTEIRSDDVAWGISGVSVYSDLGSTHAVTPTDHNEPVVIGSVVCFEESLSNFCQIWEIFVIAQSISFKQSKKWS